MTSATPSIVQTKTDRDESFPVAWLLPGRLRAPVLAYYAFARAADDIADSPALSRDEKLSRLQEMEDALTSGGGGTASAVALHGVMTDRGLDFALATDLLVAFRRDARNPACETWADLMDYCRLSAMPVGRFLLAVSGERPGEAGLSAADALCATLQVLNHVQDCGCDWRDLGRLYIPRAWLAEEDLSPDVLAGPACPPALRLVLDRVLAHADSLLREAGPLPGLVHHRRLRMQAAATLSLAHALRRRLAVGDPLAVRVRPMRRDWLRALAAALRAGLGR